MDERPNCKDEAAFVKNIPIRADKTYMCVCTCAWSYQPAVEKTSSQGVVEDHGLLTVDRLQNVFHGDRDVGVSVPRLLACLLTLN